MSESQQSLRSLKNIIKLFRTVAIDALILVSKVKFFLQSYPEPIGGSPLEFSPARSRTISHLKRQQTSPAIWLNSTAQIDEAIESDHSRLAASKKGQIANPISFSWPIENLSVSSQPSRKLLSLTIPGQPYSFHSYEEYLDEYRASMFALTFKKGGWDCFRHIEILSAGCLPLMPDIGRCPPETMAFYPKSLMETTLNFFKKGHMAYEDLAPLFSDWFNSFLTSRNMSKYVLDACQFKGSRVCFVDMGLEGNPDYMSMQLFVGMKRELGPDAVRAVYPATAAYKDWTGDESVLHGKGFGNTRILEASMRATSQDFIDLSELSEKDLLIFSDLERNLPLLGSYKSLLGETSSALIWSSDRPPTRSQKKLIFQLEGTKFFREIY